MIKVKTVWNKQNLQSMEITGHANAAAFGKDLICAGCSCVVVGLANALDEQCNTHCDIVMQENLAKFTRLDEDIRTLDYLNVGYYQLKTLAERYPKNVTIEITEG